MPVPLPYRAPNLLAPMEGVTDPLFRRLVLGLHRPEDLGGACTEFVRVSQQPVPRRVLAEALGERHGIPVAVQLMGSAAGPLAETARRAVAVGAPVIDLNFGCPAKGALRGCAGSGLLDHPQEIERLVGAIALALEGKVPVTAKLRAGGEDDSRLDELVEAACLGGAALVTLHARTRREGYAAPARQERIARAVAVADRHLVPVAGNGGVLAFRDLERLRRETGCRFVMVGRAALGDPWIFSGHAVQEEQAARFLLDYAEGLAAGGASPRGAVARVKQLLQHWTAGGLVQGEEDRRSWLRETSPEGVLARLRAASERAHSRI